MAVVARALLQRGEAEDAYHFPLIAVHSVVKLKVDYGGSTASEGTGFVLPGKLFDYVVITARHVLRPFGNAAKSVTVRFDTGHEVRAAALAHHGGARDETDCGVAMLLNKLNLRVTRVPAAAQAGVPATLEGYRAGKSDLSSVALTNVTAAGGLLQHNAIAALYGGTSGGPILQAGTVVGIHLRADVGLGLAVDALVEPCADAAYEKMKEILAP